MGDWPRVKVKDVCSLIVDCVNRTAPVVDYETPFRMIRTTNVRNGRIDLTNCRYVDEPTFRHWTRRASVKDGDVILTREAPIGEIGYINNLDKVFLGQRIMQYRANIRKINPRYLYFAFRSPELQRQFRSHDGSGSVVSHIRVADCHEFLIPLPPPDVQSEIASLLGALDDKIELNRRMNETLEAMARAVFRDWFVDFGPTRAKAEGRPPYLAPALWSLFPSRFDDEDQPEGWEMSKTEEYLELAYGKSLPAKTRRPGTAAVYGSGGLAGFHDEALIGGPAVIVGRKGTVGSLYWEDRPVFPIDTVFYVVPKRGSLLFCYQLLLTQPLADMNTDAAVPGLNRGNVHRLEFPWPGSALTGAFETLVAPLWQQRSVNLREIETLARTRDLLLPKLISGEIRLRDAKKSAGDAL